MQTKFVNLNVLSQNLGLPAKYLRQLALSRKIPVLNVNGKLRFDLDAVEHALEKLTTGPKQNSAANSSSESRVAAGAALA
jgi:hypothetical protein